MKQIRILLVDDSKEFLSSLKQFLSSFPELNIVGSALNGREGIELVVELKPDLVLIDIVMPGMDGLEATERMKVLRQKTCVVILTLHDTQEYRRAAREAGANDFLAKADLHSQFVPVLRTLFPSFKGTQH